MGKVKSKKRKRSSSNDSGSSSSSSDSSKEKKKIRKLKKKLKKEQKRIDRALKKKLKEEKKKIKKGKSDNPDGKEKLEAASSDIPLALMEKSKAMAPMTKEEWEKRQSVVRKVLDEDTGRYRLIKGDGEVLEEIVSRDRHREINKQATNADGAFFQSQTIDKKYF